MREAVGLLTGVAEPRQVAHAWGKETFAILYGALIAIDRVVDLRPYCGTTAVKRHGVNTPVIAGFAGRSLRNGGSPKRPKGDRRWVAFGLPSAVHDLAAFGPQASCTTGTAGFPEYIRARCGPGQRRRIGVSPLGVRDQFHHVVHPHVLQPVAPG